MFVNIPSRIEFCSSSARFGELIFARAQLDSVSTPKLNKALAHCSSYSRRWTISFLFSNHEPNKACRFGFSEWFIWIWSKPTSVVAFLLCVFWMANHTYNSMWHHARVLNCQLNLKMSYFTCFSLKLSFWTYVAKLSRQISPNVEYVVGCDLLMLIIVHKSLWTDGVALINRWSYLYV